MKYFLILWGASQLLFSSLMAETRVKTVFELPYQLESVTGISHKETLVKNYLNNNKLKFPHNGDPYELTASFFMAQVSYSSLFCSKMIQTDIPKAPADRWVTRAVNFNQSPQQWIGQSLESLFSDYSNVFWGRGLDNNERTLILEEWLDLLADFPQTPAAGPLALTALCSVFLSAPEFLFVQ